jgi:hypothetical protein
MPHEVRSQVVTADFEVLVPNWDFYESELIVTPTLRWEGRQVDIVICHAPVAQPRMTYLEVKRK